MKDETINLSDTTLTFKGKSGDKDYEVNIEFFKAVDAKDSTYKVLPRSIQMHVMKATSKDDEDEEFWPRLLKDKALEKNQVTIDWDRYVDEDEEEEAGGFDTSALEGGMGMHEFERTVGLLTAALLLSFGGLLLPVRPPLFRVAVWAGFVGFTLLEAVNYLEHYGLQRKQLPDGTYEAVTPLHSWNADNTVSDAVLFRLGRHSDHHAFPTRRYQILRSFPESPNLPSGYAGLIPIVLAPPLWYLPRRSYSTIRLLVLQIDQSSPTTRSGVTRLDVGAIRREVEALALPGQRVELSVVHTSFAECAECVAAYAAAVKSHSSAVRTPDGGEGNEGGAGDALRTEVQGAASRASQASPPPCELPHDAPPLLAAGTVSRRLSGSCVDISVAWRPRRCFRCFHVSGMIPPDIPP